MSRLDSFIRRLEAQRRVLNWAAAAIGNRAGPVLEIGLGNGRTYDHLREILPDRDIYAFDRACNANPRSTPPPDRLVLGEFDQTLPDFARLHPAGAALVHYDAGLGDPDENLRQVIRMTQLIPPLAMQNAIILSDQRFESPDLLLQDVPVSIPEGRYFIFVRR